MSELIKPQKVRAQDHESYAMYSLIAFLVPVVGLVLAIIMLTRQDKLDKKLGENTLVYSILGLIVWFIGYEIYASTVATNSIQRTL